MTPSNSPSFPAGKARAGFIDAKPHRQGRQSAKEKKSLTAKNAEDAKEEKSLTAEAAKAAKGTIIRNKPQEREDNAKGGKSQSWQLAAIS